MTYKMKGYSYPGKSPLKQHPKKSTESVDPDAPGTPGKPGYEPPVKREELDVKGKAIYDKHRTKDKYWYKINGKKSTKTEYIKYQNKPGGDEPGKTTNDPDVYGRKASNFGRGPKTKK